MGLRICITSWRGEQSKLFREQGPEDIIQGATEKFWRGL